MADSCSDRSSAYIDVLILLDDCITNVCSQASPTTAHECVSDCVTEVSKSRGNESVVGYTVECLNNDIDVDKKQHPWSDNENLERVNISEVPQVHNQTQNTTEHLEPSMKVKVVTVASFEIDTNLTDRINISDFDDMPKKPKNSLQEAFLHFRRKRQDEIKQERKRRDAILEANADPKRMDALRTRIIAQARKYFGVPYAKKYWDPSTPEYHSPIFLDCCGLVRQIIRDLQPELGFRLGPWNQCYMYDTLPVTLKKDQMKPGDLVFMKGIYASPKSKKQRHNMTHVEIWLGDGDKTIGSRWNNGKVGEFKSYKFSPKSFHSEEYIFKSIDTWLMGICHSYCPKHPWRVAKYNPGCKSIFNVDNENDIKDEKADLDSEDDEEGNKDEDKNDNDDGNNKNNHDKEPLSLKQHSLQATPTPRETDGTTPRSQVTGSSCSNLDGTGGQSSRSKYKSGGTKKVKRAHDMVVDADVRKTGPLKSKGKKHGGMVKSSTAPDLGKMATQALKRKSNKLTPTSPCKNISPTHVTATPIPVLSNGNYEELQYIPTNMPSRNNTPTSCAWIPTRDREKRSMKQREKSFVHPNQQTLSWNLHHSERNPSFSIVGINDSLIPKNNSCPNLEKSDVNLIFRNNTTFFDNTKEIKEAKNKKESKKEIASIKTHSPQHTRGGSKNDNRDRPYNRTSFGLGIREEPGVDECLIVIKSPTCWDRERIKDDDIQEGGKCVSDLLLSPPSSTVMLQHIRQRHPFDSQKPSGAAFSQIPEDDSLIAEISVSDREAVANNQKNNTTLPSKEKINKTGEYDTDSSTTVHDDPYEKGRESRLKGVEKELTSLSFSEEVIEHTARTVDELEKQEEANTSFCSDFDPDDDEYGQYTQLAKYYDNISSNCENNNAEDGEFCSDCDTDDELQTAIEMTVLNHRALHASTSIFAGEGFSHNLAWEWLHSLKAGESFTNRHVDCVDWTYMETADDEIDFDNIREAHQLHSMAFRKHAALPPIVPGASNIDAITPQNKDVDYFNDAYSMDVMLPPTRHTGQRPTLAGTTNQHGRSEQQSRANNLLARYVLSQQPRYGDVASSMGTFTLEDNKVSTTPLATPSLFDSNASYLSLSSEEFAVPRQVGDICQFEDNDGQTTSKDDLESDIPTNPTRLETRVTYDDAVVDDIPVDGVHDYLCGHFNQEIGDDLADSGSFQVSTEGKRAAASTDKTQSVTSTDSKSQGHTGEGDSKNSSHEKTISGAGSDETSKNVNNSKAAAGASNDVTSKTVNNNKTTSGAGSDETSKGKSAAGPTGGGGNGSGDGSGHSGTTGGSGTGVTGGSGGTTGGGGGGGGGGNRKPTGGRPSKLPQCSLPNNMQPTFFVGGGNGTALVEGPLLSLGWKRITDKYDERFRLKWVECKSKINYATFKEGEQLVNHIPNCKLLTNKLGLLSSLQEYERVTLLTKGRFPRMKMADFVPETYKLDERVDREKFLNEYKDDEVWICKPTGMNQGKGIFLLRSRSEIDQLLLDRDAKNQSKTGSRPPMMRIVQRYISNPLLLDSRKFDIRSYMLIASTVPYLVLYHKGYVRLSVQKYDHEDTNLTTHLTNQFIQKKDPTYKDVKEESTWSMDRFNDYINERVAKENGLEVDWVYGYLTKQMQRIILHCFNGVKHKLQSKMGYFDLYGMDFMVDTDFKVWLIEINVNPALHINCEALKEVIPDVVEETLHISIECFDKSRKGQPLMPLNSLRGFGVLYCGTSPNAVAPRQTRSVSPSKDGTEKNRPTGTAPSVRRASPPRNLPRMSIINTQMTTGQPGTQGSQPPTSQAPTIKKAAVSSTLPTINIGATIIQKKSAGGTSNSIRQSPLQTHQQQQQSQKQPQQHPQQEQQQPQQSSQEKKQQQPPQPIESTTQPQLQSPSQVQLQLQIQPQNQPKFQKQHSQETIGSGKEEHHRLRMTHGEAGKKRLKDNSSRGN